MFLAENRFDVQSIKIFAKKIERTHKHTRAFVALQKRTESDRIVIGGMDDENDTKKRNAYN